MEPAVRKRSHDDFAQDVVELEDGSDTKTSKSAVMKPTGDSCEHLRAPASPSSRTNSESAVPPTQTQPEPHSSPNGSPTLTEAGSSTPARLSPYPLTPTKISPDKNSSDVNDLQTMVASSKGNVPKRKRLTAVEKEAKDKELAEKKKEREEQAAKKVAEKAKQEEEKTARAKEREEKRKQKEEEDRLRAEQRDEKRRKKEEEQRRVQEEKDKKARSQPKLNAFFKLPGTPKKPGTDCDSAEGSPAKRESGDATVKQAGTEYEKLFKPFFVRENMRLAPSATQMDDETKAAKSRILDEFVTRQRVGVDREPLRFDPVEVFCLPTKIFRRGRVHPPVKHIMETTYKEAEHSTSASGPGANDVFQEARKKLAHIPQKVIAFSQDVRPPYYGTATLKPYALGRVAMVKLARKPAERSLPLDYDYDSEAEWQDEEGEDIDMEDDEEELDDEDDMDEFLDDADDAGLSRRVFGSTMEPDCTGICYENHHVAGSNRTLYEHRMEFIHGKRIVLGEVDGLRTNEQATDGVENIRSIDPFSTHYWEPEARTQPTRATQAAPDGATKMMPPPAPANAFAALSAGASNSTTPAKLVKAELLNDFKRAILDNKALSKVGIIDFIFHQFRDSVSRAEVKNTLEHVAEKKKGAGRLKEWDLKPGHEMVS
jgi:chromatin assembly factor 1 subunit A